jgi:aryl-alcohol dehydrogenase-like predicted oxidoreductase
MRTSVIHDPVSGAPRAISRLTFGGSRVGSLGNPATTEETRALMRAALDLGVNVFDTADIYGQGDSEREIGRVLKGRRDEAFVVTKFGKMFSPAMRVMRPFKPILKPLLAARGATQAVTARRDGVMREDFSPTRLRGALEASLRRLGLDHVDAILLHSPPAPVYGDPAVADLLRAVRAEGKARHFGASCETWDDVEAALDIQGLTFLQVPYDLVARMAADPMAKRLADGKIAVMAREVIRLQPGLSPPAAVAAAAAQDVVTTVVAGTGRRDHLAELARICG